MRGGLSVWIIAFALAGCLEASGDDSAVRFTGSTSQGNTQDDGPMNSRTVAVAANCAYLPLTFHTSADRVEPYMPPGFWLATPFDNLAAIHVKHLQCERLIIENRTEISPFSQAWITFGAVPPEDLRAPAGYSHEVLVGSWVSHETWAEVLTRAGPVPDIGETAFHVQSLAPAIGSVEGLTLTEAGQSWTTQGVVDMERVTERHMSRLFFVTPDGVSYMDEFFNGQFNRRIYPSAILSGSADGPLGVLHPASDAIPALVNVAEHAEYIVEVA